MQRTILGLAVAAAAAALPAQGTHLVVPSGHANAYAATTTSYPWGYPASSFPQFRYQQIHDELAGPPRVLLGLAIRRKQGGSAHPGMTATLQLDLSTAAVPSQSATSTYATNHGPNHTTVMASRAVSFPPTNPPINNLPAPFDHVLMFDQPYLHTGTGGICWEVLMTANNNTVALPFDLAQNNVVRNQTYGTGCGGASLTGSYSAPFLTQTATGLTPNSTALLLVGIDNESFAGARLPLDLGFLGAAGCALYVDIVASVPIPVDAGGTANVQTNVSALPGLTVCVQVAAPSTAVPLGLAFSNGLNASPLVPATFMRNWNSVVTSATGTLQLVYGLVVDFIQP